MIIKIDVDGVIRNIFSKMFKIYNDEFAEHLMLEDFFDYDVEKVFPKIKEELGITAREYFFNFHPRGLFLLSEPYDGVKEAIEKLKDAGYKIVIATWQYTLANKVNTLYFLSLNHIPFDDICFTKDKWMIDSDWIIDDNPDFICEEKEKSKKILVNMPYNKNIDFNGLRVNNLKEAVDIILKGNENDKD